ncbi:unnamed protein product [Rangifer tarandus platyrhynchus]|uniref:Uncharacterized protein n=2 Tax=Rangifer tarandus platyrhynchus TaxID=3082113 RepID=A0ACB0EHX7_RANTA|nr:unnamed protein product [Rangifer tarandus platyrhynchus]CAI9700298.1 unnamed protein product [Rangifer tarandus platyrhynchus]
MRGFNSTLSTGPTGGETCGKKSHTWPNPPQLLLSPLVSPGPSTPGENRDLVGRPAAWSPRAPAVVAALPGRFEAREGHPRTAEAWEEARGAPQGDPVGANAPLWSRKDRASQGVSAAGSAALTEAARGGRQGFVQAPEKSEEDSGGAASTEASAGTQPWRCGLEARTLEQCTSARGRPRAPGAASAVERRAASPDRPVLQLSPRRLLEEGPARRPRPALRPAHIASFPGLLALRLPSRPRTWRRAAPLPPQWDCPDPLLCSAGLAGRRGGSEFLPSPAQSQTRSGHRAPPERLEPAEPGVRSMRARPGSASSGRSGSLMETHLRPPEGPGRASRRFWLQPPASLLGLWALRLTADSRRSQGQARSSGVLPDLHDEEASSPAVTPGPPRTRRHPVWSHPP